MQSNKKSALKTEVCLEHEPVKTMKGQYQIHSVCFTLDLLTMRQQSKGKAMSGVGTVIYPAYPGNSAGQASQRQVTTT